MSSGVSKKTDSHLRLVSDEEAVVYPDSARPNDETPTVISKTVPLAEPSPSSQNKHPNTAIKAGSPEAIVEGLRGRRLAHFELIEPIGVGGMAAVIRARDTQLDRIVALKILPPEMAKEPENVQRFHQEAKAAAKLDHANIGRVFYCGEDQGLHFIAFEFVEGMNLRAMLEKRGKLPVAEAIRYVVQIATGLEHATSRGVVHRDVKPSNIIITPQGQAKLVDMGLARNLERDAERDLTQSGMTLGTFDYISPEQALEPREADARSDIYSLGCTLYHLLTGTPPVPEGTPAKKLDHHQNREPTDPRELNPAIPDEVVMVLGKMMAKNPKDRYQAPIQVVQHLMQVAQKVGAMDGMPEVLVFTETQPPSEPGRRPLLYIGLALAALVLLVLGLSMAPETTNSGTGGVTKNGEDNKGLAPKTDYPIQAKGPKSGSTPATPDVVKSRDDLKSVLAAGKPVIKIHKTVGLQTEGLTVRAGDDGKLEVEPEDAEQHMIISFTYTPDGSPFGLALEGGKEVVFRRIVFQVEAHNTPSRPAAGLAVLGVKTATFEQCIFVQNTPAIPLMSKGDSRLVPMASLYVEGTDQIRPVVNLKDCYAYGSGPSGGGQVAIAINGNATVNVTSTAFRPHSAFFSFRDKCSLENTAVNVDYCAGFVEMGPAFRFSSKSSARLHVGHSVFARPGGGVPQGSSGQAGLIYLAGNNLIYFDGRKNLYHNLNHFVEEKDKVLRVVVAKDFKAFLEEGKQGADADFRELPPLNPIPLQHSTPLLSSVEDPLAFQLKANFGKEFGLQNTWLGTPMPTVSPSPKVLVKKIVDPDDAGQTPGVFTNLAAAIKSAVDGDIIYVKPGEKSREVEVPPVDVKRGIVVTLRPLEGFDPILVLDQTTEDLDSYLFKIQKATLKIEQMKILLAPPRRGYDVRSVVQVGDSAHLIFDSCTFSMRPGDGNGKLNIVTLFDLKDMMKMDTPSTPPRVEFKKCFVRGKGDLVALRGCRKVTVELDDSLVALDGSLLDIDGGPKEMAFDQGVQWNMTRTSVFTKKSIFALRALTGKALAETRAKVKDCLLASLVLDQAVPVVSVKINNRDEEIKKYLQWEGEHNLYANYFNPLGNDMREWNDQVREMKLDAAMLTFPKLDDKATQSLWDATADLFKPIEAQEPMLNGIGMPPDLQKALLPPPEPEQ